MTAKPNCFLIHAIVHMTKNGQAELSQQRAQAHDHDGRTDGRRLKRQTFDPLP